MITLIEPLLGLFFCLVMLATGVRLLPPFLPPIHCGATACQTRNIPPTTVCLSGYLTAVYCPLKSRYNEFDQPPWHCCCCLVARLVVVVFALLRVIVVLPCGVVVGPLSPAACVCVCPPIVSACVPVCPFSSGPVCVINHHVFEHRRRRPQCAARLLRVAPRKKITTGASTSGGACSL
ncbi:hypothetical protein F5Y17DRAFT_285905 [Xylariaceae sp. FL0594]|nr:hypothetical protein F5Y17DRAFT_285905 [Xylariaceae sp. FL0594]